MTMKTVYGLKFFVDHTLKGIDGNSGHTNLKKQLLFLDVVYKGADDP